MTNFLPDNYEAPKAVSYYTKFEDGEKVKIRILPSGLEIQNCLTGFEYFEEQADGKMKPIRSAKTMKNPEEKHFWAFKVYNYNLGIVQICSIKQKSILKALNEYLKNEDYGDPLGYDISITRTGKGLDTEYAVIAHPPKEFTENYEDKNINWNNFYASEDPFSEENVGDTVFDDPF